MPAGLVAPTPDETEAALTSAGLMCIATGAVGGVHKSYFAGALARCRPRLGQLRRSGGWFMLELCVLYAGGTVQATYRADSAGGMPPLCGHFSALFGRLFPAPLAEV
ncbi:hypothetical protein EMIHUDRAFT_311657 [Emiliania huxleyi CCMP1516]|uniref:Uncharacterized protein n=2 Tax=Emiliania huxleyi TaxID=2903 RepID=A0A0D3IHY2_EMIH1|nr:hypothetical protein EMIHUDRAFT_311657 [Emiliania huxleyi CCMP1516]EOD10867.1 hypothetical protein EMIHUDRAFT_311657 [Emiliania huxleyi CCMP1516]|eukprot:XP_005763296.1 hypothetical protein EMIHUDRAFT_311657 [Emiliania huxleyi CCMP1516]